MSGTNNTIRSAATKYARDFIIAKYYEEFTELYRAYLINRGIPVRVLKKELVDERKLLKND